MAHARRGARDFDPEELEQLTPTEAAGAHTPRALQLSVVAVEQQVEMLRRQAELLRVATVALTLPEDWVAMGGSGYLRNVGCERVSKAWGIEIDRPEPADWGRDELPDGHVVWSVILSGRCLRTGEAKSELGSRSTLSDFYAKRWAAGGSAERLLIVYDCKKAALTNAHGRLTRALTGMHGIPIEQLKRYGLDIARIPEAPFEKGGKGGALTTTEASGKQLWKIAALACRDRRVVGLKPEALDRTLEMLKGLRPGLTGGRDGSASAVIGWLAETEEPVTMQQFLEAVGWKPEPDGSAEGSGPAAAAPGAAA